MQFLPPHPGQGTAYPGCSLFLLTHPGCKPHAFCLSPSDTVPFSVTDTIPDILPCLLQPVCRPPHPQHIAVPLFWLSSPHSSASRLTIPLPDSEPAHKIPFPDFTTSQEDSAVSLLRYPGGRTDRRAVSFFQPVYSLKNPFSPHIMKVLSKQYSTVS